MSKPHSEHFEMLRHALDNWMISDRGPAAVEPYYTALRSLEEQLEAAHEALDRIADAKKHDEAHEGYCGWCHLIDIARAANDRYPASEPVAVELASGNEFLGEEQNPASSRKLEIDPGPAEDAFGV